MTSGSSLERGRGSELSENMEDLSCPVKFVGTDSGGRI